MQRIVGCLLSLIGLTGILGFIGIIRLPPGIELLCIVGMGLFFVGLVMLMGLDIPKTILLAGLLMLLIGGFPWIYTPLLVGGVNEASGMMGTLIFIMVGIPGLLLTITGLFLCWIFR